MKTTFLIIGAFVLLIGLIVFLFFVFAPQFGNKGTKDVPEIITNSNQYKNGRFHNVRQVDMSMQGESMFSIARKMYTNTKGRVPEEPIENVPISSKITAEGKQTTITWLGHSTLFIRIEGKLILTDPVLSKRASFIRYMGPKQFKYVFPYHTDEVPKLDAILISHDHYDHLDYETIKALKDRTERFYVPLGVKAHLVMWGVEAEKIIEADWWQEFEWDGLKIVSTPARHFSGRRASNRFSTLWCSWVLTGTESNVFYGGDSGLHAQFKTIGDKYGPFDMALLECGAYSKYWPDIHSFPKQTVKEALLLRAKIALPIHWGKFNLSLHDWTEPIESFTKEASDQNLKYTTPRIGQTIRLGEMLPTEEWWK